MFGCDSSRRNNGAFESWGDFSGKRSALSMRAEIKIFFMWSDYSVHPFKET